VNGLEPWNQSDRQEQTKVEDKIFWKGRFWAQSETVKKWWKMIAVCSKLNRHVQVMVAERGMNNLDEESEDSVKSDSYCCLPAKCSHMILFNVTCVVAPIVFQRNEATCRRNRKTALCCKPTTARKKVRLTIVIAILYFQWNGSWSHMLSWVSE